MERYRALLLANWEYQKMDPLKGPKTDLERVRKALTSPDYGLFKNEDIDEASNLSTGQLATKIEDFFKSAEKDDTLLIYYSGHGGLRGDLSLALCGVETVSIDATAFDTHQLPDWIKNKGRARPTMLLLDCCFAGQAGTAKGALTLSASKPIEGVFTLGSSGMTTSPDAAVDDTPSPFTDALARVLCDPAVPVNDPRYLTGFDAFNALCKALPEQPHWGGHGNSDFRMAKRTGPIEARPLDGWRDDVVVDEVTVEFSPAGVGGSWCEPGEVHPYGRFDEHRQWAIHRLTHLIDGVLGREDLDVAGLAAVRAAWDCIGVNLFETALPIEVRNRILTSSEKNTRVLKLRLSFGEGAEDFAALPWEYLRTTHGEANDDGPPALGRRTDIIVERQGARPSSAEENSGLRALVVNGYRTGPVATGERIREQLQPLHQDWVTYLGHGAGAATWINVLKALGGLRSRYLVLVAPLKREAHSTNAKNVSIGFARGAQATPDWHQAKDFFRVLDDNALTFRAVLIMTYASGPGSDSYRAGLELCSQLAGKGRGPVAFVCHQPPYQSYLADEPDAEVFPELLIRALESGKPLDLAFLWARNRVIQTAGGEAADNFGIPLLFAAPPENQAASVAATGVNLNRRPEVSAPPPVGAARSS
ncbi:MAG TPA: caspase family protein [Candidatus Nitrosopolaris sp.]|nr:caspase family protein [Candidatus Nitrosopolaris sp.]